MHEVIRIHPEAPPKPPLGAACNGCGVCCASAPCPIGIVASRRWWGRCVALAWHAGEARYRCGFVGMPTGRLGRARARAAPLLAAAAKRYIAAGTGCDCSLEVVGPGPA